ncbi:MAG: protein kinase, partial [Bacillota bacterium]|nr:protein kinase [Bacillota bacterium]
VEGYTLKQYIARKGAIEWHEASEIALGICAAIEQAHKNKIVHRDIKPHNIMITSDGTVKVTDFGIARAVSSSTIVRGGNIIGSVHYFSPEQARGAASTYKSDIYSIGIVFYEMLVGKVPFDAEDPFKVAKMQVEQMPIEPKKMNPEIPNSINDVVLRALAKKSEDRYQSVTDMIKDIKFAMAGAEEGEDDQSKYRTRPVAPVPDYSPEDDIPETIEPEEKEKSKPKKTKKDKHSAVMGIVIGAIIVLAAVIGMAFANHEVGRNKVEDFVGKDYETIAEKYKDSDIYNIVIKDEKYSKEYSDGIIIEQDPRGGSYYTKKQLPITISVVVSRGDENLMPDYVGEEASGAEYELKKQGYDVEIQEKNSSKYDDGIVMKTIPSAGNALRKNDTVVIWVSKGEAVESEDDTAKTPANNGNTTENQTPDTTKPSQTPNNTETQTPGSGDTKSDNPANNQNNNSTKPDNSTTKPNNSTTKPSTGTNTSTDPYEGL